MSALKTYENFDAKTGLSLLGDGIFVATDTNPLPGALARMADMPGTVRFSGALSRCAVLEGGTDYCPPHFPTGICPRIGPIRDAPDAVTIWATPAVLDASNAFVSATRSEAEARVEATPAELRPTGYWLIDLEDGRCLAIEVGLQPA